MKNSIITAKVPAHVRHSLKQQSDRLGMKFSAFIARILADQAGKKDAERRVSTGG